MKSNSSAGRSVIRVIECLVPFHHLFVSGGKGFAIIYTTCLSVGKRLSVGAEFEKNATHKNAFFLYGHYKSIED